MLTALVVVKIAFYAIIGALTYWLIWKSLKEEDPTKLVLIVIVAIMLFGISLLMIRDISEDVKPTCGHNIESSINIVQATAIADYGSNFIDDDGNVYFVIDPPLFERDELVIMIVDDNKTPHDTSDDIVLYIDDGMSVDRRPIITESAPVIIYANE